jgi:hypothetical protein
MALSQARNWAVAPASYVSSSGARVDATVLVLLSGWPDAPRVAAVLVRDGTRPPACPAGCLAAVDPQTIASLGLPPGNPTVAASPTS